MFSAGTKVDEGIPLCLQPDEISEALWLTPYEAVERHVSGGDVVLAAALEAMVDGCPRYLEADPA